VPLPLVEQLPLLPTDVTTQPVGMVDDSAQIVTGPVPCGTWIL
jgi:hypothetical protein